MPAAADHSAGDADRAARQPVAVSLRWRRADLARRFRTPGFPLPQLLASAGILAALTDIVPPTILPAAAHGPYAIVSAVCPTCARVWTIVVRRQAPFAPVPVEQVLERERGHAATKAPVA